MGLIESVRGVLWARRRRPDQPAYVASLGHERFAPGELLARRSRPRRRASTASAAPTTSLPGGSRATPPRPLRQRLGVARRGRAGHRARCRSAPAVTGDHPPLQPGRGRAAGRDAGAAVPGPGVPRRGLERGDERGARRARLAVARRAARAHRGGADHHRPAARRRDRRLPTASTSAPAAPACTTARSAGRRSTCPRSGRRRRRSPAGWPTACGRWPTRSQAPR